MKRQGVVVGNLLNVCFWAGVSLTSVAQASGTDWMAPAPMGPYGGHFDFGIPEQSSDAAATDQVPMPQAAHAVYQQQDELPVIQASYSTGETTRTDTATVNFSQEELQMIDSGWALESEHMAAPLGVGQAEVAGDVWALGEIQPEKRTALVEQQPAAVAAKIVVTQEEALQPCTVQSPEGKPLLTSAHTPFQEAVLDEFEREGLDMEAMANEADRLAQLEERRDRGWKHAPAPVYFPTYMPDYALGVRRADAMDPLALIPQMRSPVQYFGFQK